MDPSPTRCSALAAEIGVAMLAPANCVQVAPPSVENHQLPRDVSTPTTAMPSGPTAAPSCTPAPSGSVMFRAVAPMLATNVPTAPARTADASSVAGASATGTLVASIGESFAASTLTVTTAAEAALPVARSTTEKVTLRGMVMGWSRLSK